MSNECVNKLCQCCHEVVELRRVKAELIKSSRQLSEAANQVVEGYRQQLIAETERNMKLAEKMRDAGEQVLELTKMRLQELESENDSQLEEFKSKNESLLDDLIPTV